MRVLVTGAAGFIGGHVADALLRSGAEVRAFDLAEPANSRPGMDSVIGDVRDAGALRRAMADCDAVCHLAAVYSYRRSDAAAMQAVNVEGTRAVLDAAARGRSRRVLHTSSATACGPVRGRPADERDEPRASELRIPYKRTKVESERLALAAARDGLDVVVVNPTTPVGAGDSRPTPTGQMVADVVAGDVPGYLIRAGLNVVAVEDVAAGHALALERGSAGERYILGGENLSLRRVLATVARCAGRRPPVIPAPWTVALAACYVSEGLTRLLRREPELLVLDEVRLARLPMHYSTAKAERALGYAFRPAREALEAATAWFVCRGRRGGASPRRSGR